MSTQSSFIDKQLKRNTTIKVTIGKNDLPLHCPMDDKQAWCSHPRVVLAIEEKAGASVSCPYCGTHYIMQ